MSQKIAAAMPVRAADKQAPAQYIRCVLNQDELKLTCTIFNKCGPVENSSTKPGLIADFEF